MLVLARPGALAVALCALAAGASAQAPARPEDRVNTRTQFSQDHAGVAVGRDGGFDVTWVNYTGPMDQQDVFAQRYAPNGAPLGAEFRVNTFEPGWQAFLQGLSVPV